MFADMRSSGVLGSLLVIATAVKGATVHDQVDVLSRETAPHGGVATEAGMFPVLTENASLISFLIAPCTEIGISILKEGGNAADAVCIPYYVVVARKLIRFTGRSSLQVFVSESSLPTIRYVHNLSFGIGF